MKIILTGSTGYIGNQVLHQCLSNPSITSIIALTRRDPKITDPKLKVILHDDLSKCPPTPMSQLANADACINCLGSNIPIRPPELNRKMNFDYAIATALMFAGSVKDSSEPSKKTSKLIYLSGALPEKDPDKRLWFLAENRRMRGELENALLKLGTEKQGTGFEIFIARPGFVQKEDAVLKSLLVGLVAKSISLQDLASSLVDVALLGNPGAILENEVLVSHGRKLNLGSDG